MLIIVAVSFTIACLTGFYFWARFRKLTPAVVPVLVWFAIAQAALSLFRQPAFIWNEIRLSRSLALLLSVPLYRDRTSLGPIIGTLHTPLSHILYLPVCWIRDPVVAILVASFGSFLAVSACLTWTFTPTSRRERGAYAIALLFCLLTLLATQATNNVIFMVHTDPAAIAFSTLACASVIRKGRGGWFAGICTGLALWSKQMTLPLLPVLFTFLFLADGVRASFRYLAWSIGSVVLLWGATAWFVGPAALWFNIWTLATHRPAKENAFVALAEFIRETKLEILIAILPVAFALVFNWPRQGAVFDKLRAIARRHPWCVFLILSAALVPGAAKATVTVGSDINHAGFVLFFAFVAGALALAHEWNSAEAAVRRAMQIFLTVGIAFALPIGAPLGLSAAYRAIQTTDTAVAWRYATSQAATKVYFPWNPWTHLRTDHRALHFDEALKDREVAGYPLSTGQLISGIPLRQPIAFPPGIKPSSQALQSMLHNFTLAADPALPRWTIFAPPKVDFIK